VTSSSPVVAIGSKNKAKIRGVKRAFSLIGAREFVEVPVKGFKEQPIGVFETFIGAAKRAVEALNALKGKEGFGVGVEAGIVVFRGIPLSGQIAVITDGTRYSMGFSSFFPLPKRFYGEVLRGRELGDIMENATGIEGIAEGIGAIGYFSQGLMTRTELSFQAVLSAILPWINPQTEYELPAYSELVEMLKRVIESL